MTKRGPESGPSRIQSAMEGLREVTELVDKGGVGLFVVFPKKEASLAFRLPRSVWDELEATGRKLGISAEKGQVAVELLAARDERVKAYNRLRTIIQLMEDGTPEAVARIKLPKYLKNKFPGLDKTVEVIKTPGSCLPPEEGNLLHFYLYTLEESFGEKDDLVGSQFAFGFQHPE